MGNQFKNAAVIVCLKTFLFVFNVVLWVSGLVLLCIGLWAEFDLYKYSTLEMSPDFSCTAPLVIIGVAGMTIIVSCVAFSCIVKGQPVLLFIYGGYLACITVLDLGLGAAVACYRDSFAKALHDGLTATLVSHNDDKPHLDFAQSTMHCCGVNNYTDWTRLSPHRVIPLSCCQDCNNCVTANYGDLFQRGCYDVITEYMTNNLDLLIALAVGAALLPLIGTVLSCVLAGYIKKIRYDAIE